MSFRMFPTMALLTTFTWTTAFAQDTTNPATDDTILSGPTAAEFVPMTRSDRASRYLRGLVAPETILRSAASAGIRHWRGSPSGWNGNISGYGQRVGDGFAGQATRRSLEYVAASFLHEDNRYFLSGEQGFARRTKYAIMSTFLARRDNGDRRVSFSRLGSAAGASFISRSWRPPGSNGHGDALVGFGISIASDVGFNVFREFWPDLKNRARKR